jgi:hypothetical protein
MLFTDNAGCQNFIDLVFLLDGSGSIGVQDFQYAKSTTLHSTYMHAVYLNHTNKPSDFVESVVNYFDIGPNKTHVGAAVFSGYRPWISPLPALFPNCPKNTGFEIHTVPLDNGTVTYESYVCTHLQNASLFLSLSLSFSLLILPSLCLSLSRSPI